MTFTPHSIIQDTSTFGGNHSIIQDTSTFGGNHRWQILA